MMAKAYVTTILLGLTIWTAQPAAGGWLDPECGSLASLATAISASHARDSILQQQNCPVCRRPMVRVRKEIRPGVWAWVYVCLECE
jgi:hypothetical protein